MAGKDLGGEEVEAPTAALAEGEARGEERVVRLKKCYEDVNGTVWRAIGEDGRVVTLRWRPWHTEYSPIVGDWVAVRWVESEWRPVGLVAVGSFDEKLTGLDD